MKQGKVKAPNNTNPPLGGGAKKGKQEGNPTDFRAYTVLY
jgi:hypothetical protein